MATTATTTMTVDIEKQVESHSDHSPRQQTVISPTGLSQATTEAGVGDGGSSTKRRSGCLPGLSLRRNAGPGPRLNQRPCESAIDIKRLKPGYPRLAGEMSRFPASAIFRQFTTLNAQNLLYLQAEIVHVESQLCMVQNEDQNSEDEERQYHNGDWFWLKDSEEDNGAKGDQVRIIRQLRELLKEYNEALLQASAVFNLPQPSQPDIRAIQNFMESDEMGPFAISGDDCDVWGTRAAPEAYAPDLITLCPRENKDSFSKWVTENAASFWTRSGLYRFSKSLEEDGTFVLSHTTLLRTTFWLTSTFAAILPVASIVILYFVHSIPVKLGIIAAFNLVVSTSLSAFTTATRTEIFSMTAAFAALQVVFISIDQP